MVKGASQLKKGGCGSDGPSPSPAGSGSQGNELGSSARNLQDAFQPANGDQNFAGDRVDQMQTKDFALDQIYGTKRQPPSPREGYAPESRPSRSSRLFSRAFASPSPAVPAVSPFALLVGPVLAPEQ